MRALNARTDCNLLLEVYSYRISVADAWIAALAKDRNATLVHKDPEFEQVEAEVQVLKLPYKTDA